MTTKSYSADELRAHAARLQEMMDGIIEANAITKREPPKEWLANVERTIWALNTSAYLAEHMDRALKVAAAAEKFEVLPPVMARMRAEAINTFIERIKSGQL